MAQAFSYEDTKPQLFLDDLHQIDVPKLFDSRLSNEQRKNLINLTRKRLSDWMDELQRQITTIKRRTNQDNRDEIKLALAPYLKLEELGKQLTRRVIDLDKQMKQGRVLPKGFAFGTEIFGDWDTGEWRFGDAQEANAFDEMMVIYHRLQDTVKPDYDALSRELKLAQRRLKQQERDLKDLMAQYKRRKSPLNLLAKLVIPFVVMIGVLAAGWVLFNQPTPVVRDAVVYNQIVGGGLLVVGLVAAMMMIVLVRRRRRAIIRIQADGKAAKAHLRELKADFKQIRLEFYPVEELYKDLRMQYKQMRRQFPPE